MIDQHKLETQFASPELDAAHQSWKAGLKLLSSRNYAAAAELLGGISLTELPDWLSIEILMALANAHRNLREPMRALALYQGTLPICLTPRGRSMIEASISSVLIDLGDEFAAELAAASSFRQHPNFVAMHNMAIALLSQGKLREGWAAFHSRRDAPHYGRHGRNLRGGWWKGEELTAGPLLVVMEQGVGECIMFASCLEEMRKAAGGKAIVHTEERFLPIMRRSFPECDFYAAADTVTYGAQALIGDGAQIFRQIWEQFPQHNGYIKPDPNLVSQVSASLHQRAAGRQIVGLSWRSNSPVIGGDKTISPQELAPILKNPNVLFVSLQHDAGAELEELRKFGDIVDLNADLKNDIDMLAAAIASCDLVISTSNFTPHLAGAIGTPVWLLLRPVMGGLWYWFKNTDASPWYPSMKIIRGDRNWGPIVQSAADQLTALTGA